MDDILKRLMDVERQAAAIVTAAEAEALRLQEAGRQQATAEAQRLRAELADEVRQAVTARLAAAESEKAAALRQAEERLQRRAQAFAQALQARADHVFQEVAYPLDATRP